MHSNQSVCCSSQNLRVYDRAPVNIRNQTVQACTRPVNDISSDNIVNAEIDTCRACLEDMTLCPLQGRSLMRRAVGAIAVPVEIQYRTRRGTCTVEGWLRIPVDVLLRVPDVAPFDLRVIIDRAFVHSGELVGNNIFTLCVTICAALFVVVESPCGCGSSHCSVCPPIPPPRQSCPSPCPPIPSPRPPKQHCPPACPPPRQSCPPKQQRPCSSPVPCLGPGEDSCRCDHRPPTKPPIQPFYPDFRVLPSLPLFPPDMSGGCDCWD